ncbi:MAG TPA: SusC/RagA family TonB-linked outer membrane protein [Puia sp.]|nr:SusC/RagA family TonB-linked outer membrane protein [Puia sp.]
MRKLLRLLWCAVALSGSLLSFSQDQTIRGVVKDPKDNTPLAGATIINQRTKKAVQTNSNGEYTIPARSGDVLTISHVGRKNLKVSVGAGSNYTSLLDPADGDMGEVVVTAMDIKRSPRELGYSVQSVTGKEIKETQRENFINSLQGRVAGATITPTNGQAGASSQIILRGFNSLSLSNAPLFIVDGVLIDNSTLSQTSNSGTGVGLASDGANHNNDYTNRVSDLSPNDIESITILKGPEATALYGSQASSGAVVITTRKPVGGRITVSYDNSFRGQKINRFNPTISDFNTGTNGVYSPTYSTTPNFFGPAYSADTKMYDNVHNFFRTGFTQSHNLSLTFGTKNSSWRLSGSYLHQDGVVPSNNYEKLNIRLANTTKVGKWLDFTPSISYINDVNNKPLRGIGGYLTDVYAWPSDNNMKNYLRPNGQKALINPADSTAPNTELDNPLFNATQNKSQDKSHRYFATFGINIYPFPWLTVAGRFGYDYYKQDGYSFFNPESSVNGVLVGGSLDNYYKRYSGYNHTITATAKKSYGKFSGRLMVGTMWQDQETKMFAVSGTKLIDSTSTDSSNTTPNTRVRLLRNVYGQPNLSIFRDFAYFGEASISYDNVLFLSYTERFEQASVFPKSTRNYSYPGVSFSAILSDILPAIKSGDVINYLKLRASLAQTARLADPYSNQSVFVNSTSSGGGFGYSFTNANEQLKPERQKTYEIGTEIKMFNNRITLEASYYNTLVKDQIVEGYRTSYATGFIINTANIASTRNQGIEATLGINPVRTSDWNWNIFFNFNKMYSKVLSLPASLTEYYLGDTQIFGSAGVNGTAIRAAVHVGGSTTTLSGWHYLRNNAGQLLIDPTTGIPKVVTSWQTLGDRNPYFTLGTTNSISYKNWNLSFLWDLKVGGAIYNGTDAYLTQIGRSKRTEDRKTPRVVAGVLQDGQENSAHPTKNNIVVVPYYQQNYFKGMPDEEFIQKNVNWFRLRDLTLNYNFSPAFVQKLKYFKTLGVFVTANDLLLFTNYTGADPAANGTTAANQGVGSFGIDYGNLPTPVSINIGLRTSF